MEGRIHTTEPRAKELRPFIEKLITKARSGDKVTNMRDMISAMGGQIDVAKKIINDIAPKYTDRTGGYTRILKTTTRAGDAAPMALIEFV
jgi:large subunit ribosomal protein L17